MAPSSANMDGGDRARRDAANSDAMWCSKLSRRSRLMSLVLFSFTFSSTNAFLPQPLPHQSHSGNFALASRCAPGSWQRLTPRDRFARDGYRSRIAPLLSRDSAPALEGSPAKKDLSPTPAAAVLAVTLAVLRLLHSIILAGIIRPLNAVSSFRWRVPTAALGAFAVACAVCGGGLTAFSATSPQVSLQGGLSSLPSLAALQAKFALNWRLYVTIPVVAGLLNWATNKLAVNMIFYPLEFFGLKIKTWAEQPFGLIGWTGIVPVKAKPMATRMVRMVTSSLIDVKEVSRRVDPEAIADILAPVAESTIAEVGKELRVEWVLQSPWVYDAAVARSKGFVASFTRTMQDNINDILDLEAMIVSAMVRDKRVLVDLFQECGSKELRFVVNSGLWLGFLLGILQMGVWLCWDPWWSLAVGGAMVGYLTNFIAIKSIFEPVDPVSIGPFKVQGLFLTRQKEVSAQFAQFLREKSLTSEQLWREFLGGGRCGRFYALLDESVDEWVRTDPGLALAQRAVRADISPTISAALKKALREEVHRVYPYMDEALELETEMRDKMRSMSSAQFESVLHPIFEEDELTLILVGAVLGFVAGFLQSLAPY